MLDDFQSSKSVVRAFYDALAGVGPAEVEQVLSQFCVADLSWKGTHPFVDQTGASGVASAFWKPFLNSFTSVQRREDIFFAGKSTSGNLTATWVCSMGHLLGLFDEPWLGIPPTRRMAFLKYVEFHRVENGQIAETVIFCDLIDLMHQAGLRPLPPQTGASLLTPGPQTHDGLLIDQNDADEATRTQELLDEMLGDLLGSGAHSDQLELARTWRDDMIWWGPAGIGASYTLERYEEQHQGPFKQGLEGITFVGHECTITEGNYGGWFGWPSLLATPTGGWLGLPKTGVECKMNLVDIYRRDGDKLAENWIFIDILGFLFQQGIDVLGRTTKLLCASETIL